MDFYLTLEKVSVLFILIIVGFAVGKAKIVDQNGQKQLTSLVLKVTMPATIILAMQQPFSSEKIHNILILIVIMICCYIWMFISSSVVRRFFPNLEEGKKDIMQAGAILSNTSFMGYPIVLSLLGEQSLFYAVICGGFIFEIISWTFGVYLIGRNAKGAKPSLKQAIINPGVISIIIGGSLFLLNIKIPEPLFSTMIMLSSATSPLAMIVVGLILSRTKIRDAIKDKAVYVTSLNKLIINPLVIIYALKFLNFSSMNIVIPTVLLSMPTAAYVAMFSANTGNDDKFASQIVFICSLFSLITIPIMTSLI
ncbi:MAG: AEC family transporter [Tissierellia bacterium]|nr:AEC family transporter [Tissierellia bacterium]